VRLPPIPIAGEVAEARRRFGMLGPDSFWLSQQRSLEQRSRGRNRLPL
jgi:hypothetical protein